MPKRTNDAPPFMSGDDVARWLADMKASGRARSDAEAARLLGLTPRHVWGLKSTGASRAIALACRAALDGLEPYAPSGTHRHGGETP